MEAIEVLRGLPVFASLDAPVLDAVASRTVARSYPRHGRVFRQGEPCQGLYIVVEGQVRIYRANREGREQVLHLRGPGQTLAEVPLFDGGPYPACARAEEASRLLFLPVADFQQLCRGYPEIADATIRELGRRLRRMVGLVEKISLKEVPARVAMTLLEYAEAGGGAREGAEFRLPRTQEELASELATTRESVARALARLRREGAIEQRGTHVRIVNLDRLQAVAWSS
ncbi:MAG TPA: Crp/Fnr family transcriptional regulator [Longimicrobium sp.]|jgi:CRP/FNR family transcriptional regulator